MIGSVPLNCRLFLPNVDLITINDQLSTRNSLKHLRDDNEQSHSSEKVVKSGNLELQPNL